MTTWTIEAPRELAFDPVRRVLVRAIRGSVNVVGSDDGRARLEVADVQGQPLRVRHEGGTLAVVHDSPWWSGGGLGWLLRRRSMPRVAISLAVPRDCPVDVEVSAASVMVSGVRQRVAVRDVAGEVTLAGLAGEVRAKTVSGAVEAQGIAGDLRLDTVSGDLTLLEGSALGSIHAQTVSGGITLDLNAARGSDIRLTSVSGDLTIRLPHQPDLQVQLHSTSGQIASAFADLRRQDMPGMRTVQGTLGRGAGSLWATTTSGHVALLRREPNPDFDDPAAQRPGGPGRAQERP
jgi:Putative adhesin